MTPNQSISLKMDRANAMVKDMTNLFCDVTGTIDNEFDQEDRNTVIQRLLHNDYSTSVFESIVDNQVDMRAELAATQAEIKRKTLLKWN